MEHANKHKKVRTYVHITERGETQFVANSTFSAAGNARCVFVAVLGRLHTHRLFAGFGSGFGREVFHTYRHYRCRWPPQTMYTWSV
jgi:hypothetical protein